MKIEMNESEFFCNTKEGSRSPLESTAHLLQKNVPTVCGAIAAAVAAGLIPFAFFINLIVDVFGTTQSGHSYFLLFLAIGIVMVFLSVTLAVVSLVTHKKSASDAKGVAAPILSALSLVLCTVAIVCGTIALFL